MTNRGGVQTDSSKILVVGNDAIWNGKLDHNSLGGSVLFS